MAETKLFLEMIFYSQWIHEGDAPYYVTARQLQRILAARFDKHRSTRQIWRHLAALESQGIINRSRTDRQGGRFGNGAQATGYTVNDPLNTLRAIAKRSKRDLPIMHEHPERTCIEGTQKKQVGFATMNTLTAARDKENPEGDPIGRTQTSLVLIFPLPIISAPGRSIDQGEI